MFHYFLLSLHFALTAEGIIGISLEIDLALVTAGSGALDQDETFFYDFRVLVGDVIPFWRDHFLNLKQRFFEISNPVP